MATNAPLASYFTDAPMLRPFTTQFQAPDDVTQQNDPGFAFRQREGQRGLDRSAFARGTGLTGGHGKALARYNQDYASNEYDKVYGRAMGEYNLARGIYDQNQNNQFNRMMQYSGAGQNAAENLGQSGFNVARSLGDIYGQKANAQAAGQVGSSNAWGNAVGAIPGFVGDVYGMTGKIPGMGGYGAGVPGGVPRGGGGNYYPTGGGGMSYPPSDQYGYG